MAPPGQAPTLVATGNDYTTTPSGEPALILRTDTVFRLITSSGFTPDVQLAFSSGLRQVLSVYDFMSISTTGFEVSQQLSVSALSNGSSEALLMHLVMH